MLGTCVVVLLSNVFETICRGYGVSTVYDDTVFTHYFWEKKQIRPHSATWSLTFTCKN